MFSCASLIGDRSHVSISLTLFSDELLYSFDGVVSLIFCFLHPCVHVCTFDDVVAPSRVCGTFGQEGPSLTGGCKGVSLMGYGHSGPGEGPTTNSLAPISTGKASGRESLMAKAAVSKVAEETSEESLVAFFQESIVAELRPVPSPNLGYPGVVAAALASDGLALMEQPPEEGLVCGLFQSDSSFGPWNTDYNSVVFICFVSCSHEVGCLCVHGDPVAVRSWHQASLSRGYFHSLESSVDPMQLGVRVWSEDLGPRTHAALGGRSHGPCPGGAQQQLWSRGSRMQEIYSHWVHDSDACWSTQWHRMPVSPMRKVA